MSLVVDAVRKQFGDIVALDGVSFTAEPGRIFGLLGANGAGKTTCMRIVLDILRADSGTVTWEGQSNAEVRVGTWGYLPEERGLYLQMTVIDVLRFFAELYRISGRQATAEVEDWLDRFRIPQYRDRPVQELSKGNQQKVQFIAAILHDPDVLIMDEPFSGLDPINVQLLKEAFLEMRDRGKALIFSTHQMETVEELVRIDRDHRPGPGGGQRFGSRREARHGPPGRPAGRRPCRWQRRIGVDRPAPGRDPHPAWPGLSRVAGDERNRSGLGAPGRGGAR